MESFGPIDSLTNQHKLQASTLPPPFLSSDTQWKNASALLFTVDVGGGHTSAADALERNLKQHNPDLIIERVELYQALFGMKAARLFASLWNTPQQREWVGVLSFLQKLQPLWELIFYLPLMTVTLYRLFRSEACAIFSTQPLGNRALIHAARLFNWWQKKKMSVHLFLTEESGRCPHYFTTLKKLSRRDKEIFTLHAPAPVLHKQSNLSSCCDEEFWHHHTGLSLEKGQVLHAPPIVRPGFWSAEKRPKEGDGFLRHSLSNQKGGAGATLLAPLHQKIEKEGEKGYSVVTQIASTARVLLLMLAKEASHYATLGYIDLLTSLFNNKQTITPTTFFYIACGNNKLLYDVCCKKAEELLPVQKKGLVLIPLSFQGDAIIGQLMRYSDVTITKSGGITSLEIQVAAPQARHYIHAPACSYRHKTKQIDEPTARSHMVLHEWENFLALRSKIGAELITPEALPQSLANMLYS